MPDAVLPLVGGEFVPVVQGGSNYKAPASAFQTAGSTNLSVNRTITSVTILSDTGDDATIPIADVSLAGVMSSADFVKLTGIQAGATANQSDSYLLNRANHTSTQTLSTISDAGTAATLDAGFLAGQLPPLEGDSRLAALDGSLLTNLPLDGYLQSVDLGLTRDTVQATITNTGGADVSIPTASGTLAGVMTSADYTKLFGIATGATANSSDANLRDRTTHTGVQPWSTIDGVTTPTTLGGYGITDAATAAQGALADSATQPGDDISTLNNDAGYLDGTTGYTQAAADAAFLSSNINDYPTMT